MLLFIWLIILDMDTESKLFAIQQWRKMPENWLHETYTIQESVAKEFQALWEATRRPFAINENSEKHATLQSKWKTEVTPNVSDLSYASVLQCCRNEN